MRPRLRPIVWRAALEDTGQISSPPRDKITYAAKKNVRVKRLAKMRNW